MEQNEETAKSLSRIDAAARRRENEYKRVENHMTRITEILGLAKEKDKKFLDMLEKENKQSADYKERMLMYQKLYEEEKNRADKLEKELKSQIVENDSLKATHNISIWGCAMAAEDRPQTWQERTIPFRRILQFGKTQILPERVQTVVDMLNFAIYDMTPEEERQVLALCSAFKHSKRPQISGENSTQNFYFGEPTEVEHNERRMK